MLYQSLFTFYRPEILSHISVFEYKTQTLYLSIKNSDMTYIVKSLW